MTMKALALLLTVVGQANWTPAVSAEAECLVFENADTGELLTVCPEGETQTVKQCKELSGIRVCNA